MCVFSCDVGREGREGGKLALLDVLGEKETQSTH